MTCIAAIEHENGVVIGCDSAQSDPVHISTIDCPKIFTKEDITFGYTGSFRFADILQYDVVIPERLASVPDDRTYLVGYVVRAIRDAMKDGGLMKIENNVEAAEGALMVYNGKLYVLQDDFSVIRDGCGFSAIGSGYQYALGSFASTKDYVPKLRVEMAVKAACQFSPTVQEPIHIFEV